MSIPAVQRSLFLLLALLLTGCAGLSSDPGPTTGQFALAIHGGAGVISRDLPEDRRQAYYDGLNEALDVGRQILADGGTSLDAVEQVVRTLEENPLFNAGKGAVYTSAGTHELDAAIMNGETLGCGAVSGITTVKHPISLARKVMEETRHVFLMGAGAESFADGLPLERVDPSYFSTTRRHEQWRKRVEEEKQSGKPPVGRSTVGAVALDTHGNLAAATSTGGLTNKRFGRVGDVPVIGAGTYANNQTCAVSCTGTGEEFIRHTVARDIAALMEYRKLSLTEAARVVIHEKLQPGDGGMIGVSHRGEIALIFNSEGMFRGAVDSSGRRDVAIWQDE